jgi:hypothetical protein
MENILTTQQALDTLRSQAEDSPILPIVVPLFNTLNYHDEYYPNRVSENDGYTQLLWKTGEQRYGNLEQVCLTLSRATLSMTIALSYSHDIDYDGIPKIHGSALNVQSSSSMVIDANSHTLHETNKINGVLLGTHYNHEAISRFTPKLTHHLAILGLYGYGQDIQLEVG